MLTQLNSIFLKDSSESNNIMPLALQISALKANVLYISKKNFQIIKWKLDYK